MSELLKEERRLKLGKNMITKVVNEKTALYYSFLTEAPGAVI